MYQLIELNTVWYQEFNVLALFLWDIYLLFMYSENSNVIIWSYVVKCANRAAILFVNTLICDSRLSLDRGKVSF